jgi:hypothetical protein
VRVKFWGALGTWVPFVPFGSSGTNGINVPQDYGSTKIRSRRRLSSSWSRKRMAAGDAQECIGFPDDVVAGHEHVRPGKDRTQRLYRVAVPLVVGDLNRIPGTGINEDPMQPDSPR